MITDRKQFEYDIISSLVGSKNLVTECVMLNVTDQDFQVPECKKVYRVILDYFKAETSVFHDPINLYSELQARKVSIELKDLQRLMKSASIANTNHLKRLIEDNAELQARQHLESVKHLEGFDFVAELAKASEFMLRNTQRDYTSEDLTKELMEFYEKQTKGEKPDNYIRTGFGKLDIKLGGFFLGDLTILAARPSMGKTATALQIARNIGRSEPVGILSMEMGRLKLQIRNLSARTKINSRELPEYDRVKSQFQQVSREILELRKLKLIVNDEPVQTLESIQSKMKLWKMIYGVKVVIIDYLQYMKLPKAESTNKAVGMITSGLKQAAKQNGQHVILLSQLNRKCEESYPYKPRKHHLRDSGEIEQDADNILMLYRPMAYEIKPSAVYDGYNLDMPDDDLLVMIIEKARDAETGEIMLRYQKEFNLITEPVFFDYPEAERYAQAPPVPYANDDKYDEYGDLTI